MAKTDKNNHYGFRRVAAAVPVLKIGNPDFNALEILKLVKAAEKQAVLLVVLPEMSLCGYSVADLYFQKSLQKSALHNLQKIADASKKLKPVIVVGLPVAIEGKIFNAAAVIHGGKIYGFVPKTYLPNYKEFYEKRWFASAADLKTKEIKIGGNPVPIGADLLFRFSSTPDAVLGIEICEDLWVPIPPSSFLASAGATIIANLSASNETVGKADYRRMLVSQQSAREICAYVYSSSGVHESTTDLVFSGHAMVAENGKILVESKRFQRKSELIISEIDMEHLITDRQQTETFKETNRIFPEKNYRIIEMDTPSLPLKNDKFSRAVEAFPFVPQNPAERDLRAREIFSIQTAALAKRLEATGIKNMVLGLSGGLDSTLALLVAKKTAQILGLPPKNILALSMPGFGTSSRTKNNAALLAKSLGVRFEEINIEKGVLRQFRDIKHNSREKNLIYENAQARYRTYTLMDKANQIKGLVVGTGDLSEIALGWNTYTGDHISHYNVNCGIPKTLIKYLIKWIAETQTDKKTGHLLEDILNTPISPELKKTKKGGISQKTEKIIGPYELHDFFLYHFVRWGSHPKKILFLAGKAWGKKYKKAELKKWLRVFLQRFFKSQWKRSVATDGPKVGSVSLSPRGDWRMPSDAEMKF